MIPDYAKKKLYRQSETNSVVFCCKQLLDITQGQFGGVIQLEVSSVLFGNGGADFSLQFFPGAFP